MSSTQLTRWATAGAAFMLAHQVAAKAVRDAYFLTVFPATQLPLMVIAAAFLSVAAVPLYARLLYRYGPGRVVPAGFLLSAAVHLLEWTSGGLTPVLAVLIYLHLAAAGALLLSGFWSLASETFDPITAKRTYGRIAAAGTFGGLAGGLAAERMAAWLPPTSLLLLLAGLHACCAFLVLGLAGRDRDDREEDAPLMSVDLLRAIPNLKPLAVLVMLGTASAAILDYLFKSQAAMHFDEADLLRFFAAFYAITQTLTLVLQSAATDRAVARYGVGDTISALPVSAGIGGIAALFVPALPLFAVARGLEAVVRGSLFRSGYELLFTPMEPSEKRRAKTFLDVACDRAGDAVGAGMVQFALAVTPAFVVSELLGAVVCMAGVSLWIGKRLNAFYARQVEQRLVDHAESLQLDPEATGWASQPSLLLSRARAAVARPREDEERAAIDPATDISSILRSGNRDLVRRTLTDTPGFDTPQIAEIVLLLAWDDVRAEAQHALEQTGARHVGLLVDHLLSPDTDFAVRRRLPRILGQIPSQRALDGLLDGLDDARFEVRFRCSRAIDHLVIRQPTLTFDRDRIFTALARELSVPRSVSSHYTVLDPDEAGDPVLAFDAQIQVSRSVEYLFSLLAAVLPREPLKAAYRAVHTDDRLLRGLALDYLNGVLPKDLRPSFWAILDVDAQHIRDVDASEVLDALLRSQAGGDVTPSASGAPGQSTPPRPATPTSETR